MDMERTKERIKILRKMGQNYREFGKTASQVRDSIKPLRGLIGSPTGEGKAKGSKLIAAGVALLAFPDPTISDLIGSSLIVAGVVRNRMQPSTMADVYREIRKTNFKLNSLKRELI